MDDETALDDDANRPEKEETYIPAEKADGTEA